FTSVIFIDSFLLTELLKVFFSSLSYIEHVLVVLSLSISSFFQHLFLSYLRVLWHIYFFNSLVVISLFLSHDPAFILQEVLYIIVKLIESILIYIPKIVAIIKLKLVIMFSISFLYSVKRCNFRMNKYILIFHSCLY